MKLSILRTWNLPTGVLGLAATPDGRRAFAACVDGGVHAVDVATGAVQRFAGVHEGYASGCVLTPDGRTLVSGGYDGRLLWHDVATRRLVRTAEAHDFWSWQLALSPDGTRVASVSGQYQVGGERYEPAPSAEPTVKVFDVATGELLQAMHHGPPVQSVAFSPSGEHVAAGNLMGEVGVWEARTGRRVAAFRTPEFTCWGVIKSPHYVGGIFGMAFTPDGDGLLLCGMGPMVDPMAGNGKMTWQRWAWREAPAALRGQVQDGERGTGLMEAIATSPDGRAFVMAGRQAQGTWNAALFDLPEGRLQASLDTKSRVTRGCFAGDGRTLLLGAAVGQARKDGKWPDWGRLHVVGLQES